MNAIIILLIVGLITLAACTLTAPTDEEYRPPPDTAVATFAGGCFWCVERDFEKQEGVLEVISGYTGGTVEYPAYQEVSSGVTGHREAVQVYYDPSVITYEELLGIFWTHVNPTDAGGQFVDRGEQYSTAIYYTNEEEREAAERTKEALKMRGVFDQAVITPIIPASKFYPAEDYHQDYYKKNPLRYQYYREGSGRDQFLEEIWKQEEEESTTIPDKIATLTALQRYVTQEGGTEKPFDNEYWDNTEEGIYVDIVSGEVLFSSTDQYKSGTGWPSFTKPIAPENIVEKEDNVFFTQRTELKSKNADSHLGHVFDDGPPPTGKRYCMNSAALRFVAKEGLEREGYSEYHYLFE